MVLLSASCDPVWSFRDAAAAAFGELQILALAMPLSPPFRGVVLTLLMNPLLLLLLLPLLLPPCELRRRLMLPSCRRRRRAASPPRAAEPPSLSAGCDVAWCCRAAVAVDEPRPRLELPRRRCCYCASCVVARCRLAAAAATAAAEASVVSAVWPTPKTAAG